MRKIFALLIFALAISTYAAPHPTKFPITMPTVSTGVKSEAPVTQCVGCTPLAGLSNGIPIEITVASDGTVNTGTTASTPQNQCVNCFVAAGLYNGIPVALKVDINGNLQTSGGGGGGGVSSVTGTANQIDVATGTTTPVISLDAAIILPGSLTVPTGSSIAVSGTGTNSATNTTGVNGGAVPASAKIVGTNSSSQPIAAALTSAHIYVGTAGNLPADVALSGDSTLSNTGAMTNVGMNGVLMSGLASGLVYNATTTGAPSIATSAQILATCTTCVVASSPGVGIAHFAGSTQTLTSSAVNLASADVTGVLPLANMTNPAFPQTITSGVSGAIPYFSSTTNLAASGLLTQYGVLFGGGAGGAPTSSAQGGSNFPLIGQGAANPVFSTISYPTSLTSGGFLYASSTTAFAGSALLATGTVPKSGGAGSAPVASSAVDSGTTYAISEPVTGTSFAAGTSPPTCTPGTAGAMCSGEGTAPTAVSAVDDIWADSTAHTLMAHANGGSPAMMVLSLPGSIQQTGKTAAITTATLCASSAGACNQAGEYHVHLAMEQAGTACSANTTNGVAFQLTWTDKNAVTHSAVTIPLDTSASLIALSGTMAWPATGVTAYASADFNLFTNGTIIQYATTYTNCTTGGAAAYDIAIAVTRVQ
jgi:hypothetical protein